MSQPIVSPAGARAVQVLLGRVRWFMIGLLVVMTISSTPSPRWLAALSVAALAMVNLLAGRLHEAWVPAMDILATVTAFVAFAPDPAAIPEALLPFLPLVLVLRYCTLGAVAGLALAAAGLLVRTGMQLVLLPAGGVNPSMLMVWAGLILLTAAFGKVFRDAAQGQAAALRERERIALGFRRTIGNILQRAGLSVSDMTYQQINAAVARVCAEDTRATAELSALIGELIRSSPAASSGLTPREEEILAMMAQGLTYSRIAGVLGVSPSTVRNHAANIMQKLEVACREDAVQVALARRVVPAPCGSAPKAKAAPLPAMGIQLTRK